jgi:hypothetical protein
MINHPEKLSDARFIAIHRWNPKSKQEWKCEYCDSLNPDNENIYTCLYCGSPKI